MKHHKFRTTFHCIILAFLYALPFSLKSEDDSPHTFKISLLGLKSDLRFFKKRTELRMARNVDFCRGLYMPTPSSEWVCEEKKKSDKYSCTREYKCSVTHKKRNRLTETRQILRELKKISPVNKKIRVLFSDAPLSNIKNYQYGSIIEKTKIRKNSPQNDGIEEIKQDKFDDTWFQDISDVRDDEQILEEEKKVEHKEKKSSDDENINEDWLQDISETEEKD